LNYILRDENAIYHACGYSNDNAIYLSLGSDSFLVTDGRYATEAKEGLSSTKVIIDNDLPNRAAKLINKYTPKRVSFDPKEWDYYSITRIQESTKIDWNKKPDFSHKKRIIKTPKEIEILAKAAKQGARAFREFAMMIDDEGIGKSEKELQFLAKSYMSKFGKYDLSFEPIVAINANAAKPHAHPTKAKLSSGDLLLFDAGLKYKRYCSDRTRTVRLRDGFVFNKKQNFKSKKIQRAYDAVLKAHDNAIDKAESGMRASKVDALTRDIIYKAGFGKYYIHSTGHGVGLDIHEMPYINSRSRVRIEDGMVYTIEPGIYIPGEFGIRIEDMVVMEEGRVRVL
jgi:Xaa-Pro aminopeptidase